MNMFGMLKAALGQGMRSYGMAALGGAAVGGAYGAFAKNTSVLGGALAGAGLGAGALGAGRFASSMMSKSAGGFSQRIGAHMANWGTASFKNLGPLLNSNRPFLKV